MEGAFNFSDAAMAEVKRLIALEREKCAKIAEQEATNTGDGEGELYIARKIAERIREGSMAADAEAREWAARNAPPR